MQRFHSLFYCTTGQEEHQIPLICVRCQHLGGWLVVRRGGGGRKTVKMKMVWLINCKHCLKDQHVYLISCLVTNGVWCECYQPAAWARDGPFLFLSAASMHTLGIACPCAQRGCSATSQKLHGSKGPPPGILALPFLLLPQTSQREDCLFLQGVTFSVVNQMTRKIIQISPPLHPPFFFMKLSTLWE